MAWQSLFIIIALSSLSCMNEDWKPTPIADVTMHCVEEKTPIPWTYCINDLPSTEKSTVLYYLHGRNGAATWWNDDTYYTADIHRHWKKSGRSPPRIISVSFGKLWLLTDWEDRSGVNLYHTFLDFVLTVIEQRLGTPVERRMLVGESMGGFSALLVGLKDMKHFSKVAALCPPLPTVSPSASWQDKVNYITSSSTSWKRAIMMLYFAQSFFPNEPSWLKNNPLELASAYEPQRGPQIYLSCGAKDAWGCMDGSMSLVKTIQQKGGIIEWVPRPGGHCDIDSASVAEFLLPPLN